MSGFNRVILVGNATREPMVRALPSGSQVVDIGIAVNRRWRSPEGEDREEVCFVDCSAFGRSGDVIRNYVHKGTMFLVEGRLRMDQWVDKNSGQNRVRHVVVVDNVQLLERRSDAQMGGYGQQYGQQYPAQGGYGQPAAPQAPRPAAPQQDNLNIGDIGEFEEILSDGEVPF